MVLNSINKLDDIKEFFVEEIQGEYKYILPANEAKKAGEFLSAHFDIGSYSFSKPDLEDILYDYYQP